MKLVFGIHKQILRACIHHLGLDSIILGVLLFWGNYCNSAGTSHHAIQLALVVGLHELSCIDICNSIQSKLFILV